jgi:hypothetical protein
MSITARRRATCPACGEHIEPGQEIHTPYLPASRVQLSWRHVECPEPAPSQDEVDLEKRGMCPSCFMVPAASGRCGCE